MNKLLIILSVLVLLPSAASAATCNVDAGYILWTSVSQDISDDCAPESAADDFLVDDADTILQIGADITLTTGTLTITAGRVILPAGRTLNPGTRLTISGGEFEVIGDKVCETEVKDPPTFAAGTVDIVTDCAAGPAATDWIVFDTENPLPGQSITGCVVGGSGRPIDAHCYRQAYEWAHWYDINDVGSLPTIQYNIQDAAEPAGYAATAAPYTGTRSNDVSVTPSAYTLARGGVATAVTVDIDTSAVDADFGSFYLHYPEPAITASDLPADECAGKNYKIIYGDENGISADDLYVLGDATKCSGGTPIITRGVRRGDRLKVVRPAVIDFDGASCYVHDGGTVRARYARFINLGACVSGDFSPTTRRGCNICFMESAAGSGPNSDSYYLDLDVAYPTTGTNDTGTLYLISETGTRTLRFPGSMLDMSGIEIARWYIHDTLDDAVDGSGTHGIFADGVSGFYAHDMRIERMTDDGVGVTNSSYEGTVTPGFTIGNIASMENMATHDNSQECFSFTISSYGVGDTHELVLSAGSIRATDLIAIGCQQATSRSSTAGVTLDGLLMSGISISGASDLAFTHTATTNSSSGCSGSNPVSCCASATCTFPNLLADSHPNRLKNALITVYGTPLSADINCYPEIQGDMENTMVWGNQQRGCTGGTNSAQIRFIRSLRESWIDFGSGSTFETMTGPNGSSNSVQSFASASLDVYDSVVLTDASITLADDFEPNVTDSIIRRLMFVSATVNTNGVFQAHAVNVGGGNDPVDMDIKGLVVSTSTIGSYGLVLTDTPVNNEDLCLNTSLTNISLFSGASNYELRNLAIQPDRTATGGIRSYLGVESDDPCTGGRPRKLGLARVSMAHMMGGDGFIDNIATWSSEDLIYVGRNAPGPVGY